MTAENDAHRARIRLAWVAQATGLFRRATRPTERSDVSFCSDLCGFAESLTHSARRVAERGGRVARATRAKHIVEHRYRVRC